MVPEARNAQLQILSAAADRPAGDVSRSCASRFDTPMRIASADETDARNKAGAQHPIPLRTNGSGSEERRPRG